MQFESLQPVVHRQAMNPYDLLVYVRRQSRHPPSNHGHARYRYMGILVPAFSALLVEIHHAHVHFEQACHFDGI